MTLDVAALPLWDADHDALKAWGPEYQTELRDGGFSAWKEGYSASSPFPRFTASIDAAVALIERVLPGWTWNIGGCPPDFLTDKDKPFGAELMGPVSWAVVDHETGYPEPVYDTANAQHAHPALALCIAALKALEARDG